MLTWLEINKKAILQNIKNFRKLVGENILIMPVIKGNAYGHGFLEIAKIVESQDDVDRICVVNLDEAVLLIKSKIKKKQILILSFFEKDDVKVTLAAKNKVVFPVYSLENAKYLNQIGKKSKEKINVAVKIDTGASRVGVLAKEALDFIKKINRFSNLQISDIYSHFASSEEENEQTEKQLKEFNLVLDLLKKNNINIPIKHMACSAATVVHKNSRFNAIRLGISLYGLNPAENTKGKIKLTPALSWYTKIIQVKNVSKNTKIGYGGTYVTKKDTRIAVLPVGYFDGYDRGLSNKSFVEIRGKKYPVAGRICMNLTMVDIGLDNKIKAGDKAVLIGKLVSAYDLAKCAETINYEIIDRINPLLPRVVV